MLQKNIKSLRVYFCDFSPKFNIHDNIFLDILKKHVEIIEDSNTPELLIYSCWGRQHLQYKDCIKLYYTIENTVPDFNQCDYAISAVDIQYADRVLYLPPALGLLDSLDANAELSPVGEHLLKRKFCSFIYSHSRVGYGANLRVEFCKELMKQYAHVDCPGAMLHNMEAPELAARNDRNNWHSSKIKFLSQYKFNIAFENSDSPGYVTEKLTDAYLANTVPIYWGSLHGIGSQFPKESMIYAPDFPDFASLINYVRKVDMDDRLYLSYLEHNPLRTGLRLDAQQRLEEFLIYVIRGGGDSSQTPTRLPIQSFCKHLFKKCGATGSSPMLVYSLRLRHGEACAFLPSSYQSADLRKKSENKLNLFGNS